MRRLLTIGLTAAAVAAAGIVTASPAQAAACAGYVGLTFDDGPGNNTGNLLNALRQNGLRATMFNEGQYAAQYPAQVRAQVDSEISRTQQAIANAGGGTPKLFRPPYGETNSTVRAVETK